MGQIMSFCVKKIISKTSALLICFQLILWTPSAVEAREPDIVEDSVRDILTVVSIGAAGAILGLSTLSFVDTPRDHLKNIVIGGALGIIVGVGVVAYNQANQSRAYYEMHALTPEFSTSQRVSWHGLSSQGLQGSPSVFSSASGSDLGVPLQFQYTIDF